MFPFLFRRFVFRRDLLIHCPLAPLSPLRGTAIRLLPFFSFSLLLSIGGGRDERGLLFLFSFCSHFVLQGQIYKTPKRRHGAEKIRKKEKEGTEARAPQNDIGILGYYSIRTFVLRS